MPSRALARDLAPTGGSWLGHRVPAVASVGAPPSARADGLAPGVARDGRRADGRQVDGCADRWHVHQGGTRQPARDAQPDAGRSIARRRPDGHALHHGPRAAWSVLSRRDGGAAGLQVQEGVGLPPHPRVITEHGLRVVAQLRIEERQARELHEAHLRIDRGQAEPLAALAEGGADQAVADVARLARVAHQEASGSTSSRMARARASGASRPIDVGHVGHDQRPRARHLCLQVVRHGRDVGRVESAGDGQHGHGQARQLPTGGRVERDGTALRAYPGRGGRGWPAGPSRGRARGSRRARGREADPGRPPRCARRGRPASSGSPLSSSRSSSS